jgi:hypothetical protein
MVKREVEPDPEPTGFKLQRMKTNNSSKNLRTKQH